MSKIPFILITGFLGSGKTSLLKYILSTIGNTSRIAIVQNEFAPGQVDSSELKKSKQPFNLLEINNGSVFCACLLDDFIVRLAEFTQHYNPEVIFLEATGLADPIALAQILQSPEVEPHLFLAGAITVVDCVHFEQSHQYLKQVRHQVQIADLILFNKSDLKSPDEQLHYQIRQWNPFAGLHNSKMGFFQGLDQVIIKLWNSQVTVSSRFKDDKHPLGTERAAIGSCVIRTQKQLSVEQITDFHQRNLHQIYRMKGYLKAQNNRFLAIQSIFNNLEIKEIANWWGPTELIVIGPGITPGQIAKDLLKTPS